MDRDRSSTIARLNDEFRRVAVDAAPGEASVDQVPGRLVMTRGVAALPLADQVALLLKVRLFEAFSEAIDPYGEHDFGMPSAPGECGAGAITIGPVAHRTRRSGAPGGVGATTATTRAP